MKLIVKTARKIVDIIFKPYNYYRYLLNKQKKKEYLQKAKEGNPIDYKLSNDVVISLYPEGQIAELLYTRQFERTEIALFIAYLKPGMNVVDIGANIGLYSIVADKIIGPTGRVWAFEPSSETHKRLLTNLSLNKTSSVEPTKIALSDVVDGVLEFRRDPGYRDGDRYLATRIEENPRVAVKPDDAGDMEMVKVTTLDYYMYAGKSESPRVDFMKMDIEGGEYSVFRGARKILTDNSDIMLLFECTPPGCKVYGHKQEDVFQFLRELGFGIYCWDSKRRLWRSGTENLVTAGNIWACRDMEQLPKLEE
jgi:FkbM family methyltransferase